MAVRRVLDRLTGTARQEGADLRFVDEPERSALLNVVRSGEARLQSDPNYRLELHAWTSYGGRDEGVPTSAFAPSDPTQRLPVRDFTVGGVQPRERTLVEYEEAAPIAILTTPQDNRMQWLRAGLALEHVLLTATTEGLVASMFTQPLELPPVRDLLVDLPGMGWPQMILRVGYGPAGRPTPRRPLNDVIDESGGRP
jgi:nitroreductase